MTTRPQVAILDDYQSVALASADWSKVLDRADVTVFTDTVVGEDTLVERLAPFDALCVMRERTACPRSLLYRLPKLRLIASTGPVNAVIDTAAADELGIEVDHTGYSSTPTIELTWALILASQRHLVEEVTGLRSGNWQRFVGREIAGRTLGIIGLGKIGSAVARIGLAFGMDVLAWSNNLTADHAADVGAVAAAKEEVFGRSDIVAIHTILSRRTRGLVDADAIALMKTDAWLVNTSRAAIIDEAALLAALRDSRIGGYAVDVFEREPMAADHPFRLLPNVLATPHIGYVGQDLYRTFYGDSARAIAVWLDRKKPAG